MGKGPHNWFGTWHWGGKACRFAEAGGDLELVDLNGRGLRTVAEELSKFEVEIDIHKVNLSS